jgi:putative ubiquitin-RnfH superfamily antitoxin RatB of RatAB toxin-antitoxin module
MAAQPAEIYVEVVYALPQREASVRLRLPMGATVGEALESSGLARLAGAKFGIFGKVVSADAMLRDGDRVEIYRPLTIDPKDARRRRAARKR